MGRLMIPCCCVCGKAPKTWNNQEWMNKGGNQDFCPKHVNIIESLYEPLEQYMAPHWMRLKTNK